MQLRKHQQKRKSDRGRSSTSNSQLLSESEIKKESYHDSHSDEDQTIPMQKLRKEMEVLVNISFIQTIDHYQH